jgi:gamma-glutamylcyclotransferase (GGCT)/AIG2-like uncharacterized protein YtfP
MHYFAYGSNMGQQQMNKRCPGSRLIGEAVLKEYVLDFTISAPERWSGGGCADVVAKHGSEVWGLLYEITQDNLDRLDEAEGPRYQRVVVAVEQMEGSSTPAFMFVVRDKAPFKEPSSQYLDIIKNAAIEHKFPNSYQSFLHSIPTQS